jgi:hypothetical protein
MSIQDYQNGFIAGMINKGKVEKVVEKIVEVPVEVEKIVEKIVEVPVEAELPYICTYVDLTASTGAIQEHDINNYNHPDDYIPVTYSTKGALKFDVELEGTKPSATTLWLYLDEVHEDGSAEVMMGVASFGAGSSSFTTNGVQAISYARSKFDETTTECRLYFRAMAPTGSTGAIKIRAKISNVRVE